MEELQLQQRLSGKGSPESTVYWSLTKRTF
jgi:hypothetical protein